MKMEERKYLDVVMTLDKEGREVASKVYSQQYFFVAKTPDFMKKYGLDGESFTVSYGTIPFAITEYYEDKKRTRKRGYRLYTQIQFGSGYVVVGVDVKLAGRDLIVNSISTVFGKSGKVTESEVEIYRDEKINPQQAALLKRPNSSQYPSIGDSDCKNK